MTYQLTVQRMTLATAIFLAIALTLFLTALSGTGVALAQANDQGGNSPATGLPTITGTAQVGETLTADRSGIADEDGVTGATFSYQWVSSDGTSDTDIAGATIATYTPVSADEGQTIKVRVSFTDDADNQEMLTSAPTAAVAAPAQADSEDEPSELSYLTVVVTEDDSDPSNVVTTFTITWNDAENCSASYNAYLDGVVGDPIHLGSAASEGEQIAASLTNVSAESIGFDAKLYCGAIGSGRLVDRLSIPEYGRSFDTVPISRAYLPKPGNYSTEPGLTALTVSSGTLTPAFHSHTLNYTVPDVANADGRITLNTTVKADYTVAFIPGSLYFYSFVCSHGGQQTFLSYQDDTGNPLYPLTDADANTPGFQMDLDEGENVFVIHVKPNCETGHLYKLTVTRATNAPANTPATGAPTISGAAQVGETLTASTSGIADADGLTGAMFSYQWLSSRDTEIQGATGAAYILVPGDMGKTIKVKVSFTDDEGNAETLTSAATGAVAPRPNSPATGAPTIGGTAQVGQTLTASTSGIADADGLTGATFSYQWLSSRDTEIQGATGAAYILVPGDVGKTIKVKVSFTDDEGNAETLTSAATGAVAPRPNSPATGAPTIGGTAQVGQTLTASTSGIADADGLTGATFSYQWLSSRDTEIQGATGAAYILVPGNAGKTIKVRVSFTDDEGTAETLTSAATGAVAPRPNSPATGAPTIGGTAQVGQTLTASTSGIADADGLTGATFSYQWLSSRDTEIQGATGAAYILVPGDVGKTIRVKVSFTDDEDNAETLTSAATGAVAPRPNSPATGAPTIGGTAQVGQTLTASTSGIADADGLTGATFSYQWLSSRDTEIQGATGAAYILVPGDVGKAIKVEVTFTDDGGNNETLTSGATDAVAARPNSPATGLPTITGTAVKRQTLTADTSGIQDANGMENVAFRYQWFEKRAGATYSDRIDGETSASYRLKNSEVGSTIWVRVYFTDDAGNEESLDSAPTATVAGDHGDTPATATELREGSTPTSTTNWESRSGYFAGVYGDLPSRVDQDWFRLNITQAQTGYKEIYFFNDGDPNIRMALYDSSVSCLLGDCETDNGRWGRTYFYLEPGIYYIRMTGPGGNSPTDSNDPDRYYYLILIDQPSMTAWYDECAEIETGFADPLYGCQTNLFNQDHPGEHINVEPVWDQGILGEGINVVLVDSGVDYTHEDLSGVTDLGNSTTNRPETSIFHAVTNSHGTSMASIIAAQHNSRGVRGIAPHSRIFSYYSGNNHQWPAYSENFQEEWLEKWNLDATDVAVSSNSWAFQGNSLGAPSNRHLTADTILRDITQGFHGKGTLYIFSANYNDNSNYSETLNYYAVTTVCAVAKDGSVINWYDGQSNNSAGYGDNLWVCAPSHAVTAVLNNGYELSGGTSVAAATVSGVAALVRSANRELTWRDVKLILANSARQNDIQHEKWSTGAQQYGGGTDRYHFNPNYGFGVVDAAAAVALAKSWTNLPPMTEVHKSTDPDRSWSIPEDTGETTQPLQVSFSILDDGRTTPEFIEHVEINIHLDHESSRDLDIWLTSPSGTVSRLSWPTRVPTLNSYGLMDPGSIDPIDRNYSFGSSKYLGENPVGQWTISVIDRVRDREGTAQSASITIRGHRHAGDAEGNAPASGIPTIDGTVEVGQSLNVDTSTISDEDGLTNAVYRYQWIASDRTADTEISGATEAAYTLEEEDVGKAIWVRVTFTDDEGNEERLTSTQSAPVAARPNTPATGLPTISGTAQVAETLTASISDIEDADGLTGATFSYQWVSSDGITDTDIREATSATYTLVVDAIGKTITARVNYTDDRGFDETLTSAPTTVVEASPNIPATGLPSITGAAEVGETLTVSTSGIQDANGLSGATFSYQWVSNDGTADMNIEEVTSTTYTLVADDIGKTIKVRVSFTDDGGNEETLTSAPTAAVEAKLNIPATGLPTIRGRAQVGETLTADASGIADHNGLENANSSYQWLADDTAIDGATGREYTLAEADKGKAIKVRVSFTDDGGNEETLTSAPTAPVWGDGPPGAPGKLTITPGDREVTLSWEPPDDNGNPPVKRYRIEWRIDGKDYGRSQRGISYKTTYTKTHLANGVKYFFRVKAENGNGNSYGPYGPASEEVSGTPTSGLAVDLGTPVLSSTKSLHHGMVQLDWEGIEGAGWYVVQYYHVKSGEWLDLPTAGVDIAFHGSSAVVSNLHGLSWLRVRAMSCAGESEWSQIEELYGTKASDWEDVPVPEVAEGDQIDPCPVILGTPVLSGPETLHHGMVRLDWQDIEDAGRYVVQYYHVKSGEWLDLPAAGVDIAFHGSSAVVSNLHGLSWLRVGAASCDGASEWSQIEELYGTNESDWEGVPVPEVEEGDEIEPCSEDADTSDNSPATGAPTITGTAQVGETLEADTSGIADADGLSNVQYEYQWLVDDADISGATNATYTLVAADEGKAIKVEVSFTDDTGNGETLTSASTDAVAAAPTPNTPATGAPTISGTAQVGETLTADTSGVADADGLSNVQYEYQWLADDAEIAGATGSTYTLTDSEEGKAITVQVSFTDDSDNEETLTSAATGAVDARPNSPATGAPTISGTAQVGETLTADTSGITDLDGMENATFTYQWLLTGQWFADDTDIAGATGSTYTLTDSEESNTVKVQVSFTDDEGNSETLTSAATDEVDARPNSPATGAPTITGTAQVGQTLTADTSGIADADGLANATFSYQWLADDTEIAGATGLTYTLVAEDEGKAIKVRVSFTDNAGNEETLTSAATAAVAGAQPTEPPAKPRSLSATATHDSVTLTWDNPGDDTITGYVILRRIPGVDPQGHFRELVPDTGTAATTYTDDTVSAETRYTYRIKAINGAGTSERSRWSHIDVPAAPVPDKPTGLEATESHGQVVLTWDDPGDDSITGYVILRRVRVNDEGGDFSVLVADTGTAALTYTDDTVAAGATYTYRIKAINEHGTSERSRWYHIDIPEAP